MSQWIKRLFCKHEWEWRPNWIELFYQIEGESIKRCTKCKKNDWQKL